MKFSVSRMEDTHDYIQWLFPLDEPSGVMSNAPQVDELCQRAFASDPRLKATLRRALDKMLGFYGMKLVGGPEESRVVKASYFARRASQWLTPGNHNFSRLTRILRSLSLLGEGQVAGSLLGCLEEIYEEYATVIGGTTYRYWRNAAPGKQ